MVVSLITFIFKYCIQNKILKARVTTVKGCQELVRFCADYRIKPHTPPLVLAPVNSFEFQSCGRTLQAKCL